MLNIDDILFRSDLGPDERARLEREIQGDPDAREVVRRWSSLLDQVGAEIDESLPDRRILVLEGLRRFGGDDFLPEGDREELSAAAGPIASALEKHPALQVVVSDVERDAVAFDRLWNEMPSVVSGQAGRARDRLARGRTRRSGLRWMWRAGAGIAVLTFASILFFLSQREAGLTTVATGSGELRVVELSDGSRVRLLANSELSYRPAEDGAVFDRFARLAGSAYFEIAPDREGFTIDLPTAVVVVLGTSFGIQANESEARIYLATGRLSVAAHASRGTPVLLEQGEMTAVLRDRLPAPPRATDVTESLEWTGLLVFTETPLSVVADRLSEVYDVDVSVDPSLERETLTGTFERSQDEDAVLEAVAAALDASVAERGDTRVIRPR